MSFLDVVSKTNSTLHPHPTQRDVTVHMNAMMPIHISNSNGSHTIIFRIIQTIMLTHQLACINISFQAIQLKQNTWTNFQSNHQFGLFNSLRTVCGLSMDSPLIKPRFHLFGIEIHGYFRPHNTQNHFHGLLNK